MIQIFPNSLTSIIVSLIINHYLLFKSARNEIKISLRYSYYKDHSPTTYFIIKSRFLTSEQMYAYLKDIRKYSELDNIIILGSHIEYEEIFKNHYRVFGVIDTTDNKSLKFIRDQIQFYLDALYDLENR